MAFFSEGKVVRYYRHPNIDGQTVCKHCGNTMHNHGWIDTPRRTVMLNHWHIEDKQRRYEPPTHWMPLPTPPKEAP